MNLNVIVVAFCCALIGLSSYLLFFQEQAPFAAGSLSSSYLQFVCVFGFLVGGIIVISLVYAWLRRRNKR